MINIMLIHGLLGHVRYNNILSLEKVAIPHVSFTRRLPKEEHPAKELAPSNTELCFGVILEYFYVERALLRLALSVK